MSLKNIDKNYRREPVFVGGFPGSGTRVVSRILSLSGIFMGSRTNDTNDSVFFAEFLNHWSGRYISTGAVADDALVERMTQDFNSFLEQHLHGLPPHGRWGAKNPRNILILPFLFSLFPEMKFIHVLRDGRDLAASHKKRIKIKQYARDLMNQEVESTGAMVDLWSAITLRGVGFGEQCMKDNYLLIRFEDLCTDPYETILGILNFLDLPGRDIDLAMGAVSPPSNAIGRWKHFDYDFEAISAGSQQVLERFGY